ncbi:1,3-beta-glucanosyltransferase gel2 [Trichoderma arundinaceum]|uniref:1,3-beta-glucanosyltransferase n=1 Tax=Trichoderma arundinaceum TaxID=490622 RepID=A0A395NZ15_TRIAR|nr:1,3-beta-glucanosyltransferase gel2 [Trichoderma arundinaceum]
MLMQSALVALAATVVGAVKPLTIQGTDFVDADGNKFQLVGVAYQPGGSAGYDPKTGKDPLSHADTCLRDAALLQVMGVNAIRVYNLDPNLNHDECASIFNAAGMYMILDVNSPLVGEAITSFEPWTSYYEAYSNRTFAIAEAFSGYPNTLLFFSGNEVINDLPSAQFVPPYLRAVTRDLKNYIKKNIKRQIPVGYSAADVREVLWDTWNYLQCSDDGDDDNMSRADVFAINSYSWCGPDATYHSSSFDVLTENFQNTSVPVFFSEYGCNTPMPRYWNEAQAIYGKDMAPVFSGGIVYEYTEEENNYGLVNITGDTLNILGDYNRLKSQLAKIDWKSVQSKKASGKGPAPPKCTPKLIQEKGFDNNFTLPVPPPGVQNLINKGIHPKPSGSLVKISNWNVKLNVKDSEGNALTGLKVIPLDDDESNWSGKNSAETGSTSTNTADKSSSSDSASKDADKKDDDSAAAWVRPAVWTMALPLVAMLFI